MGESAADRLRRNAIIVKETLSNLSSSDIKRSRYTSAKFNHEARRIIPRCIGQDEWQSRLGERTCPSADPALVRRYYDTWLPPSFRDLSVFAISIDPEQQQPYTLPQTLKVYPNVETFYANGATVDRITDRLWIIRSDMRESAARTALIDKLTTGFFGDHALSHCPAVQPRSKLALRNTQRLERLMKNKDKMKGPRYYRCTIVEPVNGPHSSLGPNDPTVYTVPAFGRLIDAHASHSVGPSHSIETIEYALRSGDRPSLYRSLARPQLPVSCHGSITVKISSPDHAPNYFDLISNPTFPGDLRNMKHLVIDVSLGPSPKIVPNISQAYSSLHLESVTFRLQDPLMNDSTSDIASCRVEGASSEETGEGHLPGPQNLARPLFGSTARVIYTPGPSSAHLGDLCSRATLDAANNRPG